MFKFDWDGRTFNGFSELCAAVYGKISDEVKHLSTEEAAILIVGHLGYHKGMLPQAIEAIDNMRAAASTYYVRHTTLEAAQLHRKATAAALKGDKSDYARGYRKAENAFMRYLEELNKGRSVKEAEDAVS